MQSAGVNLMALDRASLEGFFSELGEQRFRAKQVLQWIYQRQMLNVAQMTDLSQSLRQQLGQCSDIVLPRIVKQQVSRDASCKWLLQLADGNCIETVYIPEKQRATLCVSSQVGCALNCRFCATARQGYNRNLSVDEIIGQVWLARQALQQMPTDATAPRRPITNIVMMGMGEPLLNLDNVIPAMRLMMDDFTFGLSKRRVTLSTAGVVPGLARLVQECPVSLAVSLHAPQDQLRDHLVPLNKKYPLKTLLQACRGYAQQARQHITFEYVMLKDINDSPQQAKQLAVLLAEIPSKVNLIPFNPSAGIDYECSSAARIDAFRQILLARNIFTVTRKTRGDDIDAACGQLAGQLVDRTRRSSRLQLSQ